MKNNIYVKFSNDQVTSVELEKDEKYELSFGTSAATLNVFDKGVSQIYNYSKLAFISEYNEGKALIEYGKTIIFDATINVLYSGSNDIKGIKLKNCIDINKSNDNLVFMVRCITSKGLLEKYYFPNTNVAFIEKYDFKKLVEETEEKPSISNTEVKENSSNVIEEVKKE